MSFLERFPLSKSVFCEADEISEHLRCDGTIELSRPCLCEHHFRETKPARSYLDEI